MTGIETHYLPLLKKFGQQHKVRNMYSIILVGILNFRKAHGTASVKRLTPTALLKWSTIPPIQ